MLVAAGLLLHIPASPAGAPTPESPGQVALGLDCPEGDRAIVGEAIYPDAPPQTELAPREALREFLRRHFRRLLALRFVAAARRASKLELIAQRDGHPVASVLIARGSFGARAEGATVCESLLGGR